MSIIFNLLGIILTLIVVLYLLGSAFFLLVPTFSDPTFAQNIIGLLVLALALYLLYLIGVNLPFSINWNT